MKISENTINTNGTNCLDLDSETAKFKQYKRELLCRSEVNFCVSLIAFCVSNACGHSLFASMTVFDLRLKFKLTSQTVDCLA